MMMVKKDPQATRALLLQATFWEMYRSGFQAASLDAILRETGVTKGALYHHFRSKAALAHAVIDEVIEQHVGVRWTGVLDGTDDPLPTLQALFRGKAAATPEEEVILGCPLNNLALEMSPVEEGFRTHLQKLFNRWRSRLAYALVRGQEAGTVRPDIDANRVAAFIIASVEGSLGQAKAAQSLDVLGDNMELLALYLDGLRP